MKETMNDASANCKEDDFKALKSLDQFLQSATDECVRRKTAGHHYFKQDALPETSSRNYNNLVVNMAWLRHAGSFLSKLEQKEKCLKECPQ